MSKLLRYLLLVSLLTGSVCSRAQYNGDSQYLPVTADGIKHTIAAATWPVHQRGNHRAIVQVTQKAVQAVRVFMPWRRPDRHPQIKRLVVLNAATGKEVQNIYVQQLTNAAGSIAFEPDNGPGIYEVYYMPYNFRKNSDDARYGVPWNDYLPAVYQPAKEWLAKTKESFAQLPVAPVLRFEARTRSDFFTPMGLIATPAEQKAVVAAAKGKALIFPEDRAFPIRHTHTLPQRWTQQKPSAIFTGQALKNEYYTFQLGVLACRQSLNDVRVSFSHLTGQKSNNRIAKDSFTCFNQEGVGWDGKPLHITVNIDKDKLQPLWIGLSVPADAVEDSYESWITVQEGNVILQKVKISIQVSAATLADRGDGELWRHSRLRWLNSTLGISDEPVMPYNNVQRKNNLITATGKQLILDAYGLPQQVYASKPASEGVGLLSQPVSFELLASGKKLQLIPGKISYEDSNGKTVWHTVWKAGDIEVACKGVMEFDGTIHYTFSLLAHKETLLSDITLQYAFPQSAVPYMIGAGLAGGNRPALPYSWNWKGPWDSFWIGDVTAGLHVELGKADYNGPLLNDYKPGPPEVWANYGRGSVNMFGTADNDLAIKITTGECLLLRGKAINMECKMLITPVKQLNTQKHFSERYYQGNPLFYQKAVKEGANIINVHHNTVINPYINYPFIVRDSLVNYINEHHAAGRKVKLYYTIRELSNFAPELYALRSLGTEVFPDGPGKGAPWLWEHLDTGYKAAWYAPFPNETADVSIVMNGFSRWINYYIEGLRWMLENYKIDGLYLDDVAYDREVISRLRRILLQYNPGALLDLHSNTRYSIGPANQYTAFFPYLDRLWFGESFRYNEMTPDEWLVQFSGIPFGLMSEMLQDDGNRWLGMVYGTSNRHSWGSESPAALWKYWDDFDIKDAAMYGYWNKDCPVTCNNDSVKITVYAHRDKWLLAIGNFSNTRQQISPLFNSSLGNIRSMHAPAIQGFQKDTIFSTSQPLSIEPKKGLLLEIFKNQ